MVTTFIVHPNFRFNARLLSNKHLGKQRAEAKQMLLKIEDVYYLRDKYGIYQQPGQTLSEYLKMLWKWYHERFGDQYESRWYEDYGEMKQRVIRWEYTVHPHTMMWYGYTGALKYYINACIAEFVARGGNNNMPYYPLEYAVNADGSLDYDRPNVVMPPWLTQYQDQPRWICNMFRVSLVLRFPQWYTDTFAQYGLSYVNNGHTVNDNQRIHDDFVPVGYIPHTGG